MNAKAIIFGCSGQQLSADEITFFQQVQPWGFILFARNLASEQQVKGLTESLKATVKHQPHIFIDEEGGRVSRLRSIGGWIGPPAASFLARGAPEEVCIKAIRANYRAIGARLAKLGITADCAPILDIPIDGSDPIIGDRAFSHQASQVAPLAQACLDGLADAGIGGVIKHIPGHGRAEVDSHLSLPLVSTKLTELTKTDFVPFKQLNSAKMAMTAHIVYSSIDPDNPATVSKVIIDEIIRKQIGFDGLLMSDDLDMKALRGSLANRGQRALLAGCDMLLHCSGDLSAMWELATIVPKLTGKALLRAEKAAPISKSPQLCPKQAITETNITHQQLIDNKVSY
ncbi:MAG: beta-N-acetylhexosaminidase [Robiginitomaculum sp.]|nr:beta-N-acetylhexosaminidase [Robiginitomaculum sp.]